MKLTVVMGLAAVLAAGAAVSAQTLGDVARQEEARRKTVRAPAKVYTNDSLRAETSPAPPAATPAAPAPDAGQPAAAPGSKATPAAPDTEAKGEAYWKKRVTDERDALDRAKTFAEALQIQINSLTNDFTSHDDPVQRARIGSDRDKALAELARVQKEVQDHTKAVATIQDEARKAGAPAGWVR